MNRELSLWQMGIYHKFVTINPMALQIGFLGCGLALIGIVVATAGMVGLQPAMRSLGWPSTQGEILSARVTRQDGRPHAEVRYRYRAGETTFTGRRISYHGGRTLPGFPTEPPEAVIKRYSPGAVVPVYYDPRSPDRAVLEPGAGAAVILPFGLGGLFFLAGLVLTLMAFL